MEIVVPMGSEGPQVEAKETAGAVSKGSFFSSAHGLPTVGKPDSAAWDGRGLQVDQQSRVKKTIIFISLEIFLFYDKTTQATFRMILFLVRGPKACICAGSPW